MSDNLSSAENQQGSHLFDPSETTRRAPVVAELKAYLQGAIHDGTYNQKHKTFRISQKGRGWLDNIKKILQILGHKSWIYKEGKQRDVYALETTASFLDHAFDPFTLRTRKERIAYIRGYFDSEGGIPHSIRDPFYIQLCQKNLVEIRKLRMMLESMNISCGKIHNLSKAVDPNYWRFYVSARSHIDFVRTISSWHPKKLKFLQQRMKI